jgi:AcrR family transcriptional regulator
MFAARGHAGVAMEDVCAEAGVTRGALYHHFPGKDGLFRAVCHQIAADVTAHVAVAGQAHPDAWSRLVAGCHAFLDISVEKDVRQVLLTDAPSVLGWAAFRDLDSHHGLGLLIRAIQDAIDEGAIEGGPVDTFAHLLVSALNEAALMIGRSRHPAQSRADAIRAIDRLLDGLAGTTRSPG